MFALARLTGGLDERKLWLTSMIKIGVEIGQRQRATRRMNNQQGPSSPWLKATTLQKGPPKIQIRVPAKSPLFITVAPKEAEYSTKVE